MKTPRNDARVPPTPSPDLLDPSHYRQLLASLPLQPTAGRPPNAIAFDADHDGATPLQPQYSSTDSPHVPPPSVSSPGRSSAPTQASPNSLAMNGPSKYVQYLVAGGCILGALALMADVRSLMPQPSSRELCQTVLQPDAVLSRDHLAQLLAVSERSPKTTVRQVIAEPYCQLPTLQLRAGVPAEREAYPLEFDPDTWFVVLYEGDEYAGFDFSFRR